MALTATEMARLRKYLGWAARFHSTDSSLENAFAALASLPEDEAEVKAELAKLEDLDTRLADALDRRKASAAGPITLNASEIQDLRSEGRRIVGRIAAILGVQVKADAFGTGGGRLGGPVLYG